MFGRILTRPEDAGSDPRQEFDETARPCSSQGHHPIPHLDPAPFAHVQECHKSGSGRPRTDSPWKPGESTASYACFTAFDSSAPQERRSSRPFDETRDDTSSLLSVIPAPSRARSGSYTREGLTPELGRQVDRLQAKGRSKRGHTGHRHLGMTISRGERRVVKPLASYAGVIHQPPPSDKPKPS